MNQRPEKRVLRAAYRRSLRELTAILFQLDPVGINFGYNSAEYDLEAETILPRLRECASARDVDLIVHEELSRWFSPTVAGTVHNRAELAEAIWSWWRGASQEIDR